MPMGVLSARMMNSDASYTKDGADYYIERAEGIHRYGSKVFIMISAMSGRAGTPGGPAASALSNVWNPREMQREKTVDEI